MGQQGSAEGSAAAGVLVLTASAGVPDAAVEAARAACAAPGAPSRLGPAGVEFSASAADLAPARAAAPDLDVNWTLAAGRAKRLLICDMDSTVITVECIDEIADFAGVKAEVSAITERAMAGELDFDGALRARVALLKGLEEAALAEVYAERVRLSPGAETLARTMAALGAETALVSGGFTYFSERVAAAAGFARHQANRLRSAEGRLTGEVGAPILGRQAKLTALRRIAEGAGFSPAEAVAVGDGANDLAMIEAAGLGVAYRAKPVVAAQADARLDRSDLTAVLHLQGIESAAFVA